MPAKIVTIQDAIPSDSFQVGGEGWNQFVLLHKNVDISSDEGEDIAFNTPIYFNPGKLLFYDQNPNPTHTYNITVENIASGNNKTITIRESVSDIDYILLENHSQVMIKKTLGSETKFSAVPDFQGFGIDNLGTLKIHDVGDRNVPFLDISNSEPNTYFEILSNYNTANFAGISGATDIKVRFGFGSEIDSYQFWSQADGSNTKLLEVTETLLDINTGTVDFHNATINNILLGESQIPSTVARTNKANTYETFFQTFPTGYLRIQNTSNYVGITSSIQSANYTVNIPALLGADTFAMCNMLNIFTQQQFTVIDAIDHLVLRRPNNTVGNYVGLLFQHRNSLNTNFSTANIRSRLAVNTATAEEGELSIDITEAGSFVNKMKFTKDELFTYGMIPNFEVKSSQFFAMKFYRPVNTTGSLLQEYYLQNANSIKTKFASIGSRSLNVTAGLETGAIWFEAITNGTYAYMGRISENKFYLGSGNNLILDSAGLNANTPFTFPNLSGQLATINASQTLTSKTLTSPVINNGQLNGSFTLNTSLNLVKNAEVGVAEEIMRLRISDSTSYILFNNATTGVNKFYPRMVAYNDSSSDVAAVGMYHYYNILANSDTEDNFNAVAIFDVRRSDATAIQFKRLFQFRNAASNLFEIYTDKFNFTNKRFENAIINLDEVTIKHSTTNVAGDVPYFDGTRYNRIPQGSNNQFLGVVGGVLGYYTPTVGGVLALAGLTDDVNITNLQDDQIIQYNAGTGYWENVTLASIGESNTTANIGTGGISIIPDNDKTGSVLNFKSLFALSNKILIQDGSIANDRVEFDITEANLSIANMTGSIGDTRLIDIAWTKVTGKPSTFTPSNHGSSHVAGGTDAIPEATTSVAGIVEFATDAETNALKAVQGSDSRLSDPRTPLNHAANHKGDGIDPIAAATNTVRGTILIANNSESDATKACMSNDTRLSNSRTPTAHQSTHALDGSDPLVLKGLRTARSLVNTTPVTLNEQTQQTIHVDASAGNRTINLPSASGKAGQIFFIQKIDSSSNTVTIDGNSTETINGSTTYVLTAQYQIVMLLCDGSNWTTGPYTTERRGKSTASGNGSSTVFNIPHGLGVNPHDALIQCSSHNIDLSYTTDATNIIVTFASAPSSGTNNVIFHWSAVP